MGFFGYELVPDRETRTCLTIGFNQAGVPVLRKTSYGTVVPSALRLAMINGKPVPTRDLHTTRQNDDLFADLMSACEATWAHLSDLFPARPRRPLRIDETLHRVLDEALSVAHSHLVPSDPHIEFCGIPNEAQQGFALRGDNHASGELNLHAAGYVDPALQDPSAGDLRGVVGGRAGQGRQGRDHARIAAFASPL